MTSRLPARLAGVTAAGRRVGIGAVGLMAATLAPGLAASAGTRGSASDQAACTADVFRLCASAVPDETAILACLQHRIALLSTACQAVIEPDLRKRRAALAH